MIIDPFQLELLESVVVVTADTLAPRTRSYSLNMCVYVLRTIRMEVNPINRPPHLIETNIIKPLKARPIDLPDPMIRHQELLLPAHEHILAVRAVLVVEVGLLGLFCEGPPGLEARPVLHVFFVAGAPVAVPGLEGVFGADDFAFEEGG